jgi:hypothetical protein
MIKTETVKSKLYLLSNLIWEIEGVLVSPEKLASQYTLKDIDEGIKFYLYVLDK